MLTNETVFAEGHVPRDLVPLLAEKADEHDLDEFHLGRPPAGTN